MKKALVLLAIFALAFTLRIWAVSTDRSGLENDENEYDRLALNLAGSKGYINSGDGSPTSLRPPLYPLFLALVFRIFGHNLFVVKVIQALMGALTVCLLYLTARRIFGETVAVITGVFSSFYMTFVACTRFLYTETFFTLLVVLTTFLIVSMNGRFFSNAVIVGLLCGFLTLLRSAASLLPFMTIAFLIIKMRDKKEPFKKMIGASLILLLCFMAIVIPWTIRNYQVWGRFVLVSTNGGLNLYQGISWEKGKIFDLDPDGEIAINATAIPNEAQRSDYYVRAAVEIYKKEPVFALKMLLIKLLFFWNIIDWEILGGAKINYHYIFILPFALFGAISPFKNKKDILIPLFTILYFFSFAFIFPGTPRYRMPVDGYLIMIGSYGIYEFVISRKRKAYPFLVTLVYFLLAYLAYQHSIQVKAIIKNFMENIGLW